MPLCRKCPCCHKREVPLFRLMVSRSPCSNCNERIGHHWLYGAIFLCVELFFLMVLGLYLVEHSRSFWLGVLLYLGAVFWLTFLWSLLGPLEAKGSYWEP